MMKGHVQALSHAEGCCIGVGELRQSGICFGPIVGGCSVPGAALSCGYGRANG